MKDQPEFIFALGIGLGAGSLITLQFGSMYAFFAMIGAYLISGILR